MNYSLVVTLLIGAFIGSYVQRLRYSSEIKQLTKQLTNILPFNLRHPLVATHTHQLFTPLIQSLNQTLQHQHAQIEQLTAQEQRIKADLLNISHDLRTPLTAIYGYLELMNQSQLTSSQHELYLKTAIQRTQLLQQMIQDLFFLGKLEAGVIHHDIQPLALDSILKEHIANSYDLLQQHRIEVSLDIAPNVIINSDKSSVNRIIHNLIMNAVHHGKDALHIALCHATHPILTIRNPIRHIEQLDIHSVFKRHYTANTARNASNSGLGLTICHELCQQLNHTITARQEGNDFIIDIQWKQS